MVDRNRHFFIFRVARQTNHFHPIKQRTRHVERVGGGDEHHVRQIIIHFQIVIVEVFILLGIQHLKQCCRRVATEIVAHFIDLIEQEKRITGFRFFHALNQLAGHRPDIGTTVATNFRFITHAAERNFNIVAASRLRDGTCQRGFTNAGRANEAQNWAFNGFRARLHRQIFQNALFHFLKARMVVVEHFFSHIQIAFHFAVFFPRNRRDPVEVVTNHRCFRRHGAHVAQFFQLRFALLTRFFAQLGVFNFIFQLAGFVAAFIQLTQFLLNRFQLLIQVIFALGFFHLALHATADAFLGIQHPNL